MGSKGPAYMSNKYLILRMLSYFKAFKVRIAFSMLAMVLVAAGDGATAFLVKPAMDEIFINKDKTALIFIPILFMAVYLLKGAGRFYQQYLMQYCGYMVLEKLRQELYQKIIRLPLRFFEDNQVGMLMSRIIQDVTMIRSSLPSVIMILRQALTMIALIFVVFYRDWFLAIWAVLVLPLAYFPLIYFGRKLRKLSRKNQAKLSDISVFLQEIFSGIRVVKAFANEKKENERFDQENDRLVKNVIKQTLYNELSSPVMEVIGALGMGLVIWYGGSMVIAGESTPGTFFSFMTGLILLYEPVKKINTSNQDIQKALAGAERVFEILDSKDVLEEQGGDKQFNAPFQALELKDVSFAYSENDAPALNHVDLSIKAGQRVAIVGPSGSGKTTLINLIPLFYRPQQGAIYLNGQRLDEYSLASLRMNIGMVSQDAFLFNLSIRDNIAYGMVGYDEEDVVRAAKAAFAHDFISELPEGYDTVVGERGVKLSGGQKQRLTIARALLKNPPLLILDEATSALDTESERIVQLALENLMKDRTSIVIAHRLSTIMTADKIVVMQKGRVVAEGPHAKLLETCPLYAKLNRMQFGNEAMIETEPALAE
ncbi:ABC transporter transmembrane domain-containing protein [Desulfocurvibacter africanus]|uniref:ABC transporter ATP-binding protein n=1 Tax=Desulfocurvibacter africanus TaxID=873 RepID=UPI002FD8C219